LPGAGAPEDVLPAIRAQRSTDAQRTQRMDNAHVASRVSAAMSAVVRVLSIVTRVVQFHFISPSPAVRKPVTEPG
jgi:hypothetical protein